MVTIAPGSKPTSIAMIFEKLRIISAAPVTSTTAIATSTAITALPASPCQRGAMARATRSHLCA